MSKRFVIFSLLFSFLMASAFAIPAKPGQWRVITLSDGSRVRVVLKGDEHAHYMEDSLGNAYQRLENMSYYQLISKDHIVSRAKTLNTAHRIRRDARLAKSAKASGGLTGEKKGLIILVEFSDKSFWENHDKAYYERVANEKNFHHDDGFQGSIYDYFYAQSEGLFQLTFDIVGPVKLEKAYSYYGANDKLGDDKNDGEFAYEAISAVKDSVDFTIYDWDGDGEVDQVFLLYAGPGEANGGDDDTIWPHEWTLEEAFEGSYEPLTLDGVLINTYACGCELQPDEVSWSGDVNSWKTDGIGTICHEFSHCLGYPDFYDTRTNAVGQGMGYWDLMDSGAYNGEGFLPSGYTSYERWVAGWKEPIILSEPTTVSNLKALSEGGDSYIMYNDGNNNEYYLLENRQLTHWDEAIPGKGLLILHVDYDATAWEENTVNNVTNRQRMTWIAADNKYQYTTYQGVRYYDFSGMTNDTYPYGNNNSFGNTTTPAATLYNKNTDGQKYLNKKVYDITQNEDGSVSFSFDFDDPIVDSLIVAGDTLFYESYDKCDGKGGNDDVWSGINAQENYKYDPDHADWECNFVRGGSQCAIQGSGSKKGTVTTPVIKIESNDRLYFKAAPWGSNASNVTLNLSNENISCSPQSFSISAKTWTDCATTFTGSGDLQITFVPGIDRFFLDEVLVIRPTSTGIEEIHTTSLKENNRIYTLDGRYAGTDVSRLRPGIYLMNGKKVVINRR